MLVPDVEFTSTLFPFLVQERRGVTVATLPPSQIAEAQWVAEKRGHARYVCEQPPYSILVRGVETEVLPTCQHYGMGVIPWSPLARGAARGGRFEGTICWVYKLRDGKIARAQAFPDTAAIREALGRP